MIFLVAASERERAQTCYMSSPKALYNGGRGICFDPVSDGSGSYKTDIYLNSLESLTVEGESPVEKKYQSSLAETQVPRDTRNPVGIYEDHLIRLNTT